MKQIGFQEVQPMIVISKEFVARILILVATAFPFALANAAVRSKVYHPIPRLLNKQVIALEELISDADATGPDQDRNFHFIDIDGDGREDAVVFSTIGVKGGVGYSHYMFVFLQTENYDDPAGPYWLLVDYARIGAKSVRGIDFDYLKVNGKFATNSDKYDIRFQLRTLKYQGTDAACCPSGKGSAVFELKDNGRLVEVKPYPDEIVSTPEISDKKASEIK
ncbi:MAG: hypothetical protein V4488_19485 [Pseudomonadota bacterium]